MNTQIEKIETLRHLAAELPWNHAFAAHSARLLSSKAQSLGLDRDAVGEMLCKLPAADYIRKHPHIFPQTWVMTDLVIDANNRMSEFDQLLNESE